MQIEFRMSRSRSYELLDHGRVMTAVMRVAKLSGVPDISAHLAQVIKPRLSEVLSEIDGKTTGLTEQQAQECVVTLVRKNSRQGLLRRPSDRDRSEPMHRLLSASNEDATSTPSDSRSDPAIDLEKLFGAVTYIASLGPPREAALLIPIGHRVRFAALQNAVRWLVDFADELDMQPAQPPTPFVHRHQDPARCTPAARSTP